MAVGWGGVGMITFRAHMVDATQLKGLGLGGDKAWKSEAVWFGLCEQSVLYITKSKLCPRLERRFQGCRTMPLHSI